MEDEREVFECLSQITLGELLNGDVRLPASVQRYCALHPQQQLRAILPSSIEEFVAATSTGLPLREQSQRFEKTVVRRALNLCDGSRKRASAMLMISRVTLWNKMCKWGWLR